MNKLLLYLFITISFLPLKAQDSFDCGTDNSHLTSMDSLWINRNINSELVNISADVNLYEIPVLIRVFYKNPTDTLLSNDDIFKVIESLNTAFSDRNYLKGTPVTNLYHTMPSNRIRFKIANINDQGQQQVGITRHLVNSYNNAIAGTHALNWIFYYKNQLTIHVFDTTFSYAGLSSSVIKIMNPFYFKTANFNMSNNLLIHEIGHAFSLMHTFSAGGLSGGCVCDETDPNTQGDFIADTPPDPTPNAYTNCPHNITTHCPGFPNPLTNNFMDYGNITNSTFTPLQIDKMHLAIQSQLVTKYNMCGSPLVVFLDSIPDSIFANQNFKFKADYEDFNSTLVDGNINWKIYNAAGQLILNKDSISFSHSFIQSGTYLIKLTAHPSSASILDSCTQIIYKYVNIIEVPKINLSQIVLGSNVCYSNENSKTIRIINKNPNITNVNIYSSLSNMKITKINDTLFYISDTSILNSNSSLAMTTFIIKYNNTVHNDSLFLGISIPKSKINILSTSITSATLNATTGLYNCDAGVNLSISGGKVPYTYLWTGSNQCNSTSFSANTLNISNIASGWYTLQISDACNYSRTDWYWVGKAKRGRRLINADTKQQYLDEDIYFFLDANRNLNLSSNNKLGNIKLFNILGVLVYQKDNIMDNKLQIDCSNYPSGVYILSHFGENGIESTKFYKF
jgi:hypothetical protein